MAPTAPDPGVFVLHLEGTDPSAAQRFRYDLSAALADRAPLIVDLSDAPSLDASTLALLVEGIAACEDQQRTFLLLVPEGSTGVRERFERDGLLSLLPVVRSWDEALRRARPHAA
jgi:anti-anti-sigma regulatory factor